MPRIYFKFYEALDIDDAGFSDIYVQLSPSAGIQESSPQNSRFGKLVKDNFKFDADDQLAFTLLGDIDNCNWGVKLFLKDGEAVNCYDGIGTIENQHIKDSGLKLKCALYDNGDEDLPFGILIFSWEIRDDEEDAEVAGVEVEVEEGDGAADEIEDLAEEEYEYMSPQIFCDSTKPAAVSTVQLSDTEHGTASEILAVQNDKKTKKTTNRPVWSKFDNYAQSVISTVRADTSNMKAGTCNLSVKIHSAMYTIPLDQDRKASSAQVKLSVQPIPGKGTILRTKERDVARDGTVSFDFGMQAVTMSMSAADLHSRAYVSGCAPMVQVEFSCGEFSAVGSLYLPELLKSEGKLVALHMIPNESEKGHALQDGTMYSRQESASDGNVSVILEVCRELVSATASSMLGSSAKAKPPPLDANRSISEVSVDVKGIYGSDLKEISKCLVETSLCASGMMENSGLCDRAFRKGVSVDHTCTMQSDCLELDVLLLKVFQFDAESKPKSLGVVQIPLSAVVRNDSHLSGCFQAVQVEPPQQKGLNRVTLRKWGVVCDVVCKYLDPEDDEEVGMNVVTGTGQAALYEDEMEVRDAEGDEMDEMNATSHIAKRKFETVKSVDGRLSVCVHGFVPKYGGPCALAPSDMLAIEFSLPNSAALNDKSEGVRVCRIDERDPNSPFCALWEKEFLVPVVWALQQRYVGFLQGVLVRTANMKPGETVKDRRVIGFVSLDLASMVNMRDKPIVCALPVLHKQCSHEDYQDSIGYVMLGLQFNKALSGHVRCTTADCADQMMSALQKKVTFKKSVAWGDAGAPKRLEKRSIKLASAMSPLPLPPSAFSDLKKLCLEHWPLFCNYLSNEYGRPCQDAIPRDDLVHVSMSLNSIEAVAGPLRELLDNETVSVIISSNEGAVTSGGSVNIESGKISLRQGDLEIPLNLESNASILITMKIARNDDNDVLGVASIVLPRDLVITGRPMNVAVPLRDANGLKTAIIICGCHFSSAGFHAITAPISDGADASDSNYMLNVCVIEGSVRDGDWTATMEPYFECTLISSSSRLSMGPPVQGISMEVAPAGSCVGYTPTVDLNSAGDWNARCSIPIPTDALAEASRPSSLWTLDVKCRDGARVQCPHIAHTQVSIPWSVLGKGKPQDLWVTLVPTVGSTSESVFGNGEDVDVDVDEEQGHTASMASRIHIRLDRSEKVTANIDVDNTVNFPGVGQIAMWYHSIREGENRSEKSFGPDNIRAVDAVVQMSNPATELFEYEDEHIPFRSTTIEARQSTYEVNHVADMLSGKVIVPGGRSVTHLRLRTRHDRFPLLTSLPTLSTLPKPHPAMPNALSTDIPIIETVLRPDQGGNHTAAIRQRLSRLKLGAVFVPYVSGYMYIQQSNLEVHETAAERFQETPAKRGALKYCLGGVGSCFTPSFQMAVSLDGSTLGCGNEADDRSHCSSLSSKSNPRTPSGARGGNFKRRLRSYGAHSPVRPTNRTGSKKVSKLRKLVATQKGPPSPKASTGLQTEAVDPFIFVNTFDMLSGLGKSSDDAFDLRVSLLDMESVGKRYCFGVGHLQTAAIYYQALRNIFCIENKGGIISRCTVPTPVKLFDPVRHVHLATVTITLKFELTAINADVIKFLRAYKQAYSVPMSPATGISVGRAELGLKQAFQLADKDNSGGVSSAELGATIRSITSKSNTGSIVGFDTGAIRLLLTLMEIVNGPPHDDESAHSEERIAHLFRMMDLDGDGQVSWWEWRQVLDGTATVINVGEPQEGDPPRYIDALDPLVVSLEAAHAALMAENGGIVKPKPRQALDDYDMNALDNPLLGKNKQYQERLAALRSKNSRLQKKLEEALSSSQTVTPPPARAYPISRRTDEIDDEMRKMLEAEKRRRTELEAEVERLNNVSSEMVKSRSEGELERAAMSNRLAEEANRLREEMILAYMSRKQYERSAFVLRRFFLMVRENMLAKKIARERQRLVHAMTGLVARKKYIGIKSIRNDAAVKVQSHYRRVMGKRKCDLITQSVRIIQEAVLMRNLRRAAKAERAELWKQLVQLKLNAGLRIQKAMLRCVLNKKRQEEKRRAAVLIQSRYRGHLSRRVRPADEAEPMILKIVSRPPLENAVGLWISHPRHNKENGDDNEREALVMSVDKSAEVMRVRYLEEDPVVNVVVNYHDSRISHWFKMSTPEEERSEIQAVTKLQAVMRGRLSRVRVNGIIANKAAIKIQAIFRGRRVRKLLNLPREQEHAATKIQAVFRGRRDRERISRLHTQGNDQMKLIELDYPPPIEKCTGYWIVRENGEDSEGYVEDVDVERGLMTVIFDFDDDDNRHEAKVSIDEPGLSWFRESVALQPLPAVSVDEDDDADDVVTAATRIQALFRGRRGRERVKRVRAGTSSVDDAVVLVEVEEPPPLEMCSGYWIIRKGNDDSEGMVRSVNAETRMMTVEYDNNDSDVVDEVVVAYDEEGLVWLLEDEAPVEAASIPVASTAEESKAPAEVGSDDDVGLVEMDERPPIEKCTGYWIIRKADTDREGLVDRVNTTTRMMLVMYEKDDSDSVDELQVPYDEKGLIWMKEEG